MLTIYESPKIWPSGYKDYPHIIIKLCPQFSSSLPFMLLTFNVLVEQSFYSTERICTYEKKPGGVLPAYRSNVIFIVLYCYLEH